MQLFLDPMGCLNMCSARRLLSIVCLQIPADLQLYPHATPVKEYAGPIEPLRTQRVHWEGYFTRPGPGDPVSWGKTSVPIFKSQDIRYCDEEMH